MSNPPDRWVPFGFGPSRTAPEGVRDWNRTGVAVLVALHLLLTLALQARLGAVSAVLWYVGPSLLAGGAVVLLGASLMSAIRHRATWSRNNVAWLVVLVALAGTPAIYRTYPSAHDGRPSAVQFRVPLSGPVTVASGGSTAEVNNHVIAPDQRWGYDLVVTSDGRSFEGSSRALTDYHAYGLDVVAPAAGTVHTVHDNEPDLPIGGHAPGDDLGNFVVLEVGPDAFLYIAHLQRGSIPVRPGDRVEAGDLLGRVGNSGKSTEPHVHVHLQDSPRRHVSNGVPFYFSDYCRGGTYVARGMPEGGAARGQWTGAVVEHALAADCASQDALAGE
jgi:hypothetical protein